MVGNLTPCGFLMYRVEFKDSLGIKGNFSDQTFLMYRVELKGRDSILYEDNVFPSLVKKEEPFGVSTFLEGSITPRLRKSHIL